LLAKKKTVEHMIDNYNSNKRECNDDNDEFEMELAPTQPDKTQQDKHQGETQQNAEKFVHAIKGKTGQKGEGKGKGKPTQRKGKGKGKNKRI
jgi:hypothetical protein